MDYPRRVQAPPKGIRRGGDGVGRHMRRHAAGPNRQVQIAVLSSRIAIAGGGRSRKKERPIIAARPRPPPIREGMEDIREANNSANVLVASVCMANAQRARGQGLRRRERGTAFQGRRVTARGRRGGVRKQVSDVF